MKMKNYLYIYLSNIDEEAVTISVSHREIYRIRDQLLSEQLPYKILNLSTMEVDDLDRSTSSRTRHFKFVRTDDLTNNKKQQKQKQK